MSDMETLNVVPRGEVQNIYSWESKEIQFYNGMVVHNRKRARAKKMLSFVVYGKENMLVYLRDFYDRHHGLLDKFYFNYDGVKETCQFAEKITFKQLREVKTIVGYSAEIKLQVDRSKVLYQGLPEFAEFDFPIRGTIEDTDDWNTNILETLANAREKTWNTPIHTFTFNMNGKKAERDRLLALYNRYGDFSPLQFINHGNIYSVYMPSELTVTDIREMQNIVGYKCQMTLTSDNGTANHVVLKPYSYLFGESNEFYFKRAVCYLSGKEKSEVLGVNKENTYLFGTSQTPQTASSSTMHLVILGVPIKKDGD